MASADPLSPRFITWLAAGDPHIEKAARNLNGLVTDFATSFSSNPAEMPTCRALASQGASLEAHVKSHLGVAQWLLGVRMKEHLIDLVNALLNQRILNAALISRGIIESAAAIVYLHEKLEGTLRNRSEEAYQIALYELHRSIGGGRFDWFSAKDDDQMLKHLEVYRTGDDPEVPSDRRATSILTMLVKLDRRFQKMAKRLETAASPTAFPIQGGVVRAVYAQLCDFCHPGTGIAILLSGPGSVDGWVKLKSGTAERETQWFFWNLGIFVAPVCQVAYEALSSLNTVIPES